MGVVIGITLLIGFIFDKVSKNIEKVFDGYRFD